MPNKIMTPDEYMAKKARAKKLAENPAARTPCGIVLDISGSMEGMPIEQLNLGTQMLIREILTNKKARSSVEVCVIAYDYDVNCIREFDTVSADDVIPEMVTRGGTTHTGTAVNEMLDKIEVRIGEYSECGVDSHRPRLILISDGEPYGEAPEVTDSAIRRIAEMTANGDLHAYTVGVGDKINRETLQKFSPDHAPLHVDTPDQFRDLFKWISESVIEVANNRGGYAAPENVCRWNEFRPGEEQA